MSTPSAVRKAYTPLRSQLLFLEWRWSRMELPFDVRLFVDSTFIVENGADALATLCGAHIEDGTFPSPRLLRCAAVGNRGRLPQLRRFISLLAVDWRDVIMFGEYELRDSVMVQVRDLSCSLQVSPRA